MKSEVKLENQLRRSVGKFRPTYLLLGGNNTVLISMWRGGGMRSTECPLVVIALKGLKNVKCEYSADDFSRSLYAVPGRLSSVCLSVVCIVRAPYSRG